MSRVEWSRYSGDDVEHLVAMLMCRESPNAERIRPSSGDGGIDVRVPAGTGFEIYQMKKFAQNLGSSEKAQIVKSLKRLVKYAKQTGLSVLGWHLTMPLDPTPENTRWFTAVTKEVGFPCTWKGLPFIDGLAAKYPDIVDYYLRDGRQRLEAALSDLSTSMSMFHAASTASSLAPADAIQGLVAVFRAVNALDPHYRYEFDVAATMRPVPDEPWLMFATTEGSEGAYVTYRVYAKFKEAASERPVTVEVRIPTTDPDLVDAIDDFRLYGKPFKSPPVAAIKADLPGGLGGSFDNGVVRLGSVGNAQEYALRFQAVDPEGRVLASTTVNMRGPWTGPSRQGARVIGTEVAGCFTVEIRTELETQRLELDLSPTEIAGRPVTSILDGIRVLDQVGEPNTLRIAPLAGPVAGFDPLPPFSFPANPAGRRLVEALATIQDHTTSQITVPADDELTRDLVMEVDRAARILRGEEVVTALTSADIGMTSVTADFADGPAALMLVQPLTVTLGGERIVLGEARVYVPAAQASLVRDEEAGPRIRLAPLADRPLQMLIRLASDSD